MAELGSSKIHGIKADARVEEEVFKLFEVRSDLACDSRDNDSRSIRIEATASFRRTLYRDALVEDLILIFRSRVYFQETEKRFGPITLCVHNIGANVSFSVEQTTTRV